ncbi:hypothetical protein [Herbaspirillum huttiense]|uniref:hypothetical protein n=1 Tax=Herbaspirillum huttiense TaxID=863372 RepID=UPI0039AED4A7
MSSVIPPEIDDSIDPIRPFMLALEAASSSLSEIDDQLHRVDALLHQLQPPFSGRIRILFVPKAADGLLKPECRVFRRVKETDWFSKHISHKGLSRRLKRAGAFKNNYEALVQIAKVGQQLMEARAKLVQRRTAARLSLEYLTRHNRDVLALSDPTLSAFEAVVAAATASRVAAESDSTEEKRS